jgi:hypothetical protein
MNFIKHFWLLLVMIFTTFGLGSKTQIQITPEQAVYETLMLQNLANTHEPHYLVEETEVFWFKANPFNKSWKGRLKPLGGIDMALIETLYAINQQPETINWQPFLTNMTMLPAQYNVAAKAEGDLCFTEDGSGNVGVFNQGREYRSYFTLSRVAFSTDRLQAMVKFSYHCAPMSGAREGFAVFTFKDHGWQQTGGWLLWVS